MLGRWQQKSYWKGILIIGNQAPLFLFKETCHFFLRQSGFKFPHPIKLIANVISPILVLSPSKCLDSGFLKWLSNQEAPLWSFVMAVAEVPVFCSYLVPLVQGPCCFWGSLGCRTVMKVVTCYLCPLGLSIDQVFPRSTPKERHGGGGKHRSSCTKFMRLLLVLAHFNQRKKWDWCLLHPAKWHRKCLWEFGLIFIIMWEERGIMGRTKVRLGFEPWVYLLLPIDFDQVS